MKHTQTSIKKFKFAVDFGTTNTHIEYKVDTGAACPFNITESDIQTATLFQPDETTTVAIEALGLKGFDMVNINTK